MDTYVLKHVLVSVVEDDLDGDLDDSSEVSNGDGNIFSIQ